MFEIVKALESSFLQDRRFIQAGYDAIVQTKRFSNIEGTLYFCLHGTTNQHAS